MENRIKEIAEIFTSLDQWNNYLEFIREKEKIKSFYYKHLFDKLRNGFEDLCREYIEWESKQVGNTDLRIYLKGKSHESISICCDVSKESDFNFCFSLWAGGKIEWNNLIINEDDMQMLNSLNILHQDGRKKDYLIWEDIPKSLFNESMNNDLFAYYCFSESDKIVNYIINRINEFFKNESSVKTFKSIVDKYTK